MWNIFYFFVLKKNFAIRFIPAWVKFSLKTYNNSEIIHNAWYSKWLIVFRHGWSEIDFT
jgi:hypothetical protein